MDGKGLAERIRAEVAQEVEELGQVGLSTILVGDDPASDIYISRKQKAAKEVGIDARDYRLADDTSEEELLDARRSAELPTTRSTGSSSSCRCPRTSTSRG